MDVKKMEQLEAMLTTCRDLGIDERYRPEYGHFASGATVFAKKPEDLLDLIK